MQIHHDRSTPGSPLKAPRTHRAAEKFSLKKTSNVQERNGFREEWKTRGSISVLNYDRNVSRAREVVVVVDNKAEDEGDVFIKRTINSFKQFLWNNSKNHFRVFVFSSQIFFFSRLRRGYNKSLKKREPRRSSRNLNPGWCFRRNN